MACATCGAALSGPFCSQCGQRVRPRLTLGGVAREAVQHVLSLDSGLLRTAVDLARRPAGLITDVLAGRTVRYAGPVRYFLVAVTAAQVLSLVLGDVSGMADSYAEGYEGADAGAVDRERVALNIERFWVFAFVGLVPFVVLWSRLLLRRAGLTLAEHAAVHLYLLGQVALGVGLSVGLGEVAYEAVGDPANFLGLLLLLGPFGLYLWASVGVFGRGRAWSPAAMALSLVLGLFTYMAAGTFVSIGLSR